MRYYVNLTIRHSTEAREKRMARNSSYQGLAAAICLALAASPAVAQPAPFLAPIAGALTTTPGDIANQNVLALNTAMFDLYATAGQVFQRNILAQHPLILGLFSGAGGRFILYRPGQKPIEAPPVPIVYQLLKSVGHSTMALSEVVGPYLDNPANQGWRASLLAYRSRMQSALDTLDQTDMPDDWRSIARTILANNVDFMDQCAQKGAITTADIQAFADKQGPELKKVIAWAAQTQVDHWMKVIGGWKAMLGADWDKTYAASNTIYVTRQNNVLFSMLAQFFGPDAINDRLLLIETISFTTTPQDMLEAVTRIIADRSVGALFFKNYHLMDYELMGGDARDAILADDKQLGITPILPPAVPFGSHQFPTLVTPGAGASSLADLP
jgi:hypothetical protein